nr:MAG TPA: hypothetical protein [Bacteriophage sp.]
MSASFLLCQYIPFPVVQHLYILHRQFCFSTHVNYFKTNTHFRILFPSQ